MNLQRYAPLLCRLVFHEPTMVDVSRMKFYCTPTLGLRYCRGMVERKHLVYIRYCHLAVIMHFILGFHRYWTLHIRHVAHSLL